MCQHLQKVKVELFGQILQWTVREVPGWLQFEPELPTKLHLVTLLIVTVSGKDVTGCYGRGDYAMSRFALLQWIFESD